jgi:hypothetical protein
MERPHPFGGIPLFICHSGERPARGQAAGHVPASRGGCRIEGWTTAVEDRATWVVEYAIEVDAAWATRSARIRGRSAGGFSLALLQADGAGRWLVDGKPARLLDG